jgi:aldose sugar dehydrogenase
MRFIASCVRTRSAARSVICGASLLAAACGGNSSMPPPTVNPPSDSPVSVTGTEKIGWDQLADDANQLARIRYVGFVDDAPQELTDAACGSAATAGAFACVAKLPSMSVGLHRLELAAVLDGLQSPKSSPLALNLVGTKSSAAVREVSRAGTTFDGVHLIVETLAVGLTAPSALAATPDGRLFVAERAGGILVLEGGKLLPTPALELRDVAQTNDVGLIGIALHPDFGANGRVFVAYTARDRDGGFVNRVVRFRDVRNNFGQAAVILEDRVLVAPLRPPRIRVGPDRVVYVAFQANDQSTAESSASYAGKILRINDDGTTPRDNQGSTPVISSGNAVTGGLAWQPATNRLWLTGRDWQSRDFVADFLLDAGKRATFDSLVDPSGMAFYSQSRVGAFANDLFVGALAGRHLRRIHFSRANPGHIELMERLLDGQYGRISDVVTGTDGALYITTSNAGTATAAADDDRLLRVAAEN